MRAELLTLRGEASDAAVIARAAALIRAGRLVVFPTETVYGLGANALDEAAVARIFEAKGRPSGDPLIVHVADTADVAAVAADVPAVARTLMSAFWPGPLTIILSRGSDVPLRVTAGGDTVAVRMPQHPVALALLRASGVPIAAPSANRFSRPSPTRASDVVEDLGERVDMILDGGPTTHGVESTVIDVAGGHAVVLRPGAITLEALREVVPSVTLRMSVERDTTTTQASPGTLLKHYSPRAAVRLWTGAPASLRLAIQADVSALLAQGLRVGALLSDEDLTTLAPAAVVAVALGSERDLASIAARLFAAMRELDRAGVDVIVTRDFGRSGLGLAIWDRLYRSAEGRVLESNS